jgi:hypothetical protein
MDHLIKPIKKPYVKSGLVLYLNGYDFKNAPNTVLLPDRSAAGNNGTPANFAYTTASGSNNFGGIAFDGNNDVINCGHASSLNSNYITLEALIYISVDPIITGRLITKELTTAEDSYSLAITADHSCAFLRQSTVILYSTYRMPFNTLTHIALTTDGTNAKFYVNGRWDNGIAFTGTIATNAYDVLIGNNPSSNRQFHGNLKMARIYNRGLLGSEIMQNYKSTK